MASLFFLLVCALKLVEEESVWRVKMAKRRENSSQIFISFVFFLFSGIGGRAKKTWSNKDPSRGLVKRPNTCPPWKMFTLGLDLTGLDVNFCSSI